MAVANLNTSNLNTIKLNNGGAVVPDFETFMRRLRGSKPCVKIEFIEIGGTVTDITEYHISGGNFEQVKERAPDEIQAGNFDITLSNNDNTFSEFVSGSFLDGKQYHGASIRVSVGFVFDNGSTQFLPMGVGIIDQLKTHNEKSEVTFRCRDRVKVILDKTLRPVPDSEIPVFGINRGNGTISTIESRPFSTQAQDWTLLCTTGGADGVAQFSVIGTVSGSIGPATSGAEFSDATAGIKFTLSAGNVDWAAGDTITFSQEATPEWDFVNPAKIIWSVLTGYNYDTNTQEAWSDSVLALDNTQSSANTDINWDSFVESVADLGGVAEGFGLRGFIQYAESAKDFFESLLILFLGSIYTDNDGKIVLATWVPSFGETSIRAFKDERKITALGYIRSIDEVINSSIVKYKKANTWEFSGFGVVFDGIFTLEDTASIAKFGELTLEVTSKWHSANGQHVENFSQRIIGKFASPPLNIDFNTGLDALKSQIGDIISVTDEKYGFSNLIGEITKIEKVFDEDPKTIAIRLRKDQDAGVIWGFLGSSVDEGDGLSPQSLTFAGASDEDKRFCYIDTSTTNGIDYRMF